MIAGDIFPLSNIRQQLSRNINIMIDSRQKDASLLIKLKQMSADNKGRCGVMLHLRAENGNIRRIRAGRIRVNPNHKFIQNLREIFGQKSVWIS